MYHTCCVFYRAVLPGKGQGPEVCDATDASLMYRCWVHHEYSCELRSKPQKSQIVNGARRIDHMQAIRTSSNQAIHTR